MDSRWKSFSEVVLNIAVGFLINYTANVVILPAYGMPFNAYVFLEIGILYTLVSIARQYLFRRLFEHFGEKETLLTLTIRLIRWLRGR